MNELHTRAAAMAVGDLPGANTSEAAIFARLWEAGGNGLTPTLARHVLKVEFSEADLNRMRDLARRNQESTLTEAELTELDNYIKVGDLLAILRSKARKLLNKPAPASRG